MKSRKNIWLFVLLLLLPSSLLAEPIFLSDIVKEVFRAEGNKEPVIVQVGVRIHQITAVDQKQENFGIVVTIFMYWNNPQLSKTLLEDGQQYNHSAMMRLANGQMSTRSKHPGIQYTINRENGTRNIPPGLYLKVVRIYILSDFL